MGGWRLEIAKMALYVTFPVAMFHYFNQAQYFEEWVIKMKRELYPPEDSAEKENFRRELKKLQSDREKKLFDSIG